MFNVYQAGSTYIQVANENVPEHGNAALHETLFCTR